MTVASWSSDFDRLTRAWQRLTHAGQTPIPLEEWTDQIDRMQETMRDLQDRGRWAAGPHDLMSIVGLNRWELAHSAAIAWLCTPDAGHGLGTRFLDALIAATGDPVITSGPVTTTLEEGRVVVLPGGEEVTPVDDAAMDDAYEELGEELHDLPTGLVTRADVVVRGADWTLVVEVKVDATEGRNQAHRLYEGWKDDPGSRFLFLTRHGQSPNSIPEDLKQQWTPLRWRDLRNTLEQLAGNADPHAVAHNALTDYLMTLRTTF